MYLMSGGADRSDWVRNMRANPTVNVRIGVVTFQATADVGPDLDERPIREAMAAKYQGWEEGDALSDWARTALVVRLSPAA
jgi:hypothetical protein